MSWLSRVLCLTLLVAAVLPSLADAAPQRHPPLGAADQAEVKAAEDYLNGITTLKARFLQISDNGAQAEGSAYLNRPGKLRLQYDPPSPLLVVADGTFLIVHDKTLDNPSYIPLGSTPAGVLVRDHVALDKGDLMVTKVSRQPGLISITVVEAEDVASGSISLIFSERPFQLKQWRVVDGQGQTTAVSLYEITTGIALDHTLFEFENPNFGRPKL